MNKPHKILLVEDDQNLGQVLKEYLEVKGFEPTLCRDGEAGLKSYQSGEYDLCLFDVMMPKIDGFSLAQKIRKKDEKTPIIFLTAKSMKEDTIQGFQVGADDYITKPFSMEELLMRIKAILRRTDKTDDAIESVNEFEIGIFRFRSDIQELTNTKTNETQKLTSKESALLKMLCFYKNHVLDRSLALKKIWGDDNYFNSRSMDVYITKLRKFLKADERLQILNVHGQGFRLVEVKDE
ncbi:MAG: response regulator transcription factor [Flammeovirgaceae bacterium]|nr:response regulator transcription factor [Flammeovirgaceae bacterium]MDW8286538.1 response regulator transcription factor [Flammeovirgaceae bacterium]